MSNMQAYINEAEAALLHTYNRYPIVFEKGEGVYLYDTDGKKYLDFFAGIAVSGLGYSNEEYKQTLKDQVDALLHTSNYYYNPQAISAAKRIQRMMGFERVFFTNSGAEAVEGAIKAARKYAYLKDGCTDHEIIAMEHSFHGRTMGALSITGNPKYREAFEPLIGHVKFATINDLDSVKAQITDKTRAIFFEWVHGEVGIHPATKEFLEGVRAICDEKDILMILDEIQCGVARTGYLCAWQRYGIKPDIMTCAKGIGCGVPVGTFMMNEKVGQASLVAGDHGTTYGGNPFACAAVDKVLEIMEREDIPGHVQEVGDYLTKQLEALAAEYPDKIIERRGLGFLQGLEFKEPVADIIKKALEKGLVLINAGTNIIRFVPPLVIEKEHVDEMMRILRACI